MRNLTKTDLAALAENVDGPVALTRREFLMPVAADGIVFPPTYAGGGYAIDDLSDGTKTVIVDSVGSQANRMEILFVRNKRSNGPFADLVPQVGIEIERRDEKGNAKDVISIMEAGHRLGDALIRSSELADDANEAFALYRREGDAALIAKLSPTTLVFGAWDSRDTQAKLPRIVQSIVRAWDVDPLKRSAQYAPPVDYAELDVFTEAEREKAEGKESSDLAKRGFVHVPSVDTHGGVRVNGEITRDITVNLTALRQLGGDDGDALRCYILGLALAAATAEIDGFYRQGCHLVPDPEAAAPWRLVKRDGTREEVLLDAGEVRRFAAEFCQRFGKGPDKTVPFDKKKAQADAKKK